MKLSQALVGETIPPRERGRYQDISAGVAVSSSTFGPVAGGYLTQAFGWQSIFLVNVPLGFAALPRWCFASNRNPPIDVAPPSIYRPGSVHHVRRPVILALEQVQRMQLSAIAAGARTARFRTNLARSPGVAEKLTTSPLIPPALFRQPSIWRSDAMAPVTARRSSR